MPPKKKVTFHGDSEDQLSKEMLQEAEKPGATIEVIENLLEKRASINATDHTGYTLLHIVAEQGNNALVTWLIDKKNMLVDSQSQQKSTPLFKAIYKGHHATVALLLAKGANPQHINALGQAPLHMAAMYDKTGEVLTQLLGVKAIDLYPLTQNNKAPLDIAAEKNNNVAIELLLECGVCVTRKDTLAKIKTCLPNLALEKVGDKYWKQEKVEAILPEKLKPNKPVKRAELERGVVSLNLNKDAMQAGINFQKQ